MSKTKLKSGRFAYPRNAYIPFSDGVCSCIGKRFAQIEGICSLASPIQKYQVSLAVTGCESRQDLGVTCLDYFCAHTSCQIDSQETFLLLDSIILKILVQICSIWCSYVTCRPS